MLDFVKEKLSVWDRLRQTDKPIVLYGMGNGADKIIDWCEQHKVQVSAVFASDGFVRNQQFRGFTVCSYHDVLEKFGDNILIVIAFASELPEVLARFQQLASKHEVVAPHLPLFSETELVSSAWLRQYAEQLQKVYGRLGDELSRKVFAAALNYKLSGDIKYLFDCESQRQADLRQLFTFTEQETYLDLGAYNGDTVQEFLQLVHGRYKQIVAVEPDRRNFKKLERLTKMLPQGFAAVQKGIWQQPGEMWFSDSGGRQSTLLAAHKKQVPVDSVDHLGGGLDVSYIKMDVEGAEKEALAGGLQTIKRCRPKILLAAYHYDNDLFQLPLILWEMVPEYKIYLRKHPYVPCWELNYFAVCEKQRDK